MTELNLRVNAVDGNSRTVGDIKKKWADMKVYFKVILLLTYCSFFASSDYSVRILNTL